MTAALAGVLGVLVFIAAIAAAIKGLPVIWHAAGMPGRMEQQLEKLNTLDANLQKLRDIATTLEKLDGIEEAANEARDEWHGATEALNRLSDNYERRLSALEAWRRRVDRTS